MTKLTLSVDERVVAEAKRLAEQNRTSVSAMFSQFVRALASGEGEARRIGPLTRRASGLARLPADADADDLLTDALMDKYGLTQ